MYELRIIGRLGIFDASGNDLLCVEYSFEPSHNQNSAIDLLQLSLPLSLICIRWRNERDKGRNGQARPISIHSFPFQSSRVVQSAMPIDEKKAEVVKKDNEIIIGETPENELKISPRWLIFPATDNYSKPLRSTLSIENLDEYPIAFAVRGKVRHMPRFNFGYGILKENESISLDVLVPAMNEWRKSEENIIGIQHKLAFENLRLPPGVVIPDEPKERAELGKQIFRATQSHCPFLRLYTKTNLVLLPAKPAK